MAAATASRLGQVAAADREIGLQHVPRSNRLPTQWEGIICGFQRSTGERESERQMDRHLLLASRGVAARWDGRHPWGTHGRRAASAASEHGRRGGWGRCRIIGCLVLLASLHPALELRSYRYTFTPTGAPSIAAWTTSVGAHLWMEVHA